MVSVRSNTVGSLVFFEFWMHFPEREWDYTFQRPEKGKHFRNAATARRMRKGSGIATPVAKQVKATLG